jgi:hypothetical protein
LGRCGKTRLAKALNKENGVKDGLYVAMEDFGTNPERLENRILYLIKSKSPELEEAIAEGIHFENGVQVLNLSSTYLDTHDVSFEDIEVLKASLLKQGNYSQIVFDIGSAAFTDLRILAAFEYIYMPVLEDDLSEKKLMVFEKLLKEVGLRNILTRITKVALPDVDEDSDEMKREIQKLIYG